MDEQIEVAAELLVIVRLNRSTWPLVQGWFGLDAFFYAA
jgi:hypothetical protein